MRLNRTANTKRNIIVGEIDRILGILFPFVVRTLIIHMMGSEYLGLTGLFYSIIQMLNLAEMGFGSAIVYSMYKPIADGDTRSINVLLKYYARIYRRVGYVTGVGGLIVMFFLPYMVKDDAPKNINVYLLYLIYLFSSVIIVFCIPTGERCCLLFREKM